MASGSSITEQCQRAENRIADHRLTIIDTPGLYDTNLSKGETTLEIIRCLRMSAPGPHAFLLVLRLDRFTKEEIDTFTNLFDLFGEEMSSFAIIIFTKIDDLEGEDTSIDEFINRSNKHLKHFISKVDGRYIAFNNRGTEEQKRQQVANFTKILDEMIQKNNGQHYTNKMYQDAEAELQRTIKEVENKKQREVAQIVSKCKDKISEIETSNRLREKKKEETQSILKDIQLKLLQMNKDHDKELFEVRQEAKKMEEIKLQELHLREEENRILIKEIKINQREAEERMKILENCRQTTIDDCYKSLMQQTIEAVMKLFHNTDVSQPTQGDIETTKELRKSLKESTMMMQQNEESDKKYIDYHDPEKIFRMFFGTEHNKDQLESQTENESGCLIM